jgi:hypothetical protein
VLTYAKGPTEGSYLGWQVLTVEPGCYFIRSEIEKALANAKTAAFMNADKLREMFTFGGIRLEDNVLVTEEGYVRSGVLYLSSLSILNMRSSKCEVELIFCFEDIVLVTKEGFVPSGALCLSSLNVLNNEV